MAEKISYRTAKLGWGGGGKVALHFNFRTIGRRDRRWMFAGRFFSVRPQKERDPIRFEQMQPRIYHTACHSHSRTFDLNDSSKLVMICKKS